MTCMYLGLYSDTLPSSLCYLYKNMYNKSLQWMELLFPNMHADVHRNLVCHHKIGGSELADRGSLLSWRSTHNHIVPPSTLPLCGSRARQCHIVCSRHSPCRPQLKGLFKNV